MKRVALAQRVQRQDIFSKPALGGEVLLTKGVQAAIGGLLV